jgi:hypothetical protein
MPALKPSCISVLICVSANGCQLLMFPTSLLGRPKAQILIINTVKEQPMATLAATPSLETLYTFIDKVNSYPITIRQLISVARDKRAPKSVVNFYEAFDPSQEFEDKEDLISRSEQVEIMREQEAETPREEERAPEDY